MSRTYERRPRPGGNIKNGIYQMLSSTASTISDAAEYAKVRTNIAEYCRIHRLPLSEDMAAGEIMRQCRAAGLPASEAQRAALRFLGVLGD